ncbi:hypothetical protein ZHAS_00018149 [Anopheles sinensis]|uniref:Kinesin motor domain-containing protein n=1 Tax=Anopheles sinensis TaxID=74873 RepID=A0A084WIQ2_ANOSI|nr:hypothetical protein ZHAS_00018149 [Anopheles sinensis]
MVYKAPGTSTSSRGVSPQRPPHHQKHPSTMPSSSSSSSLGPARGGQSLMNLNNYRDNTVVRGRRRDAFHTNGTVRKVNNGNDAAAGAGMKRSNSLNNKYNNGTQAQRSNSIERMNNGKVYRGRSPLRNSTSNLNAGGAGFLGTGGGGRNQPILVRSRGNDIGSMDNLDNITQASTGSSNSMPGTPEDNINVVVRVRPLSAKEARHGDDMCDGIPLPSGGASQKPKLFSYNVVFEPGATQDDVLQYSGIKRLIEMAIEGFSCTAFCYGQTGSGKTHTLTGPPELFYSKPDPSHEDHGLVFRSFLYLFKLLQERKDTNFILKASFLEIYNEKARFLFYIFFHLQVIDLLNPGTARKPLAVRWSKKSRGFFVENLFTVDCEELDDLLAVLEEEIGALQVENEHLRTALNLQTEAQDINSQVDLLERRPIPSTPPKVDLDKITDMESNELKELVKVYIMENQALRQENSELYSTRELIIRDQELVCRENERLLKKLEDVNSPTFSAEMLNLSAASGDGEVPNIWRNPLSSSADSMSRYRNESLDGRVSANENKIPDLIQKELDKRRIGDSLTQSRYPSVSSSGVSQPPWRNTVKRASSAQKPSSPMFLRKQNNLLAKSRSTDESIVSLNRNIFGSLLSLDVEEDIAQL